MAESLLFLNPPILIRPSIHLPPHRALARGLVVLPGVLTPTEAFLAVKHGARILKLFPSQVID